MAFPGIVTKMILKVGERTIDLLNKTVVKHVPDSRPRIKVCMLGARGVGKTSVITSMYNSMDEAVRGTGLFLSASPDTQIILNTKRNDLKGIFRGNPHKGALISESGIEGDASESLFEFTYGFNKEKVNIDLEIRDYPGEYLEREPETVASFINEASAIMIAIDTPCLMEEDGRYDRGKNRLDLVADFLLDHLDNQSEKLLLLVPLKCEKYYLENRIDEVRDRVKAAYIGLIDHFRDQDNMFGFKHKVCCAVTPIQTLGTVKFHDFGRSPDGSVNETEKCGMPLPREMQFEYAVSNANYAPVNCEQPLYYLLSFISKQYRKEKEAQKTTGFIGRLLNMFNLIPKVEEFFLEIQSLAAKRIDGTQGYQIFYGKGRI